MLGFPGLAWLPRADTAYPVPAQTLCKPRGNKAMPPHPTATGTWLAVIITCHPFPGLCQPEAAYETSWDPLGWSVWGLRKPPLSRGPAPPEVAPSCRLSPGGGAPGLLNARKAFPRQPSAVGESSLSCRSSDCSHSASRMSAGFPHPPRMLRPRPCPDSLREISCSPTLSTQDARISRSEI